MLASGSTVQSPIPTTGMRGGLGRTLLTAFLILAIAPLWGISWYATVRERRDVQYEVSARLSAVEAEGRQWVEHRTANLALLAALPATAENVGVLIDTPAEDASTEVSAVSGRDAADATAARDALYLQLSTLLSQDVAFRYLAVLDQEGRMLVSAGLENEAVLQAHIPTLELARDDVLISASLDPAAEVGLLAVQRVVGQEGETLGFLVGWIGLDR